MAKEWLYNSKEKKGKFKRETLLNYAMNRWGLNKAHSVGSTSELIRNCSPINYREWEKFYFDKAYQKKKKGLKITKKLIHSLGETLYVKLSEVVQNELLSITEDECINYAYNLVLKRTFEGYVTEIETIYGQLENLVRRKIEPASDEWDRKYCVDFFIKIKDKFIGIQIKPISSGKALNQYQWIEIHKKNHQRFEKEFGGKVFFIYSMKRSGKKTIYNTEVIELIKSEIERLEKLKISKK